MVVRRQLAVFLIVLISSASLTHFQWPGKAGGSVALAATGAGKYGEITVGHPKVWEFERVHVFMDALLRDVEGISLERLRDLDPNQANATLFRFIQTLFKIGGTFDQEALVKNRLAEEPRSRSPG